MRNTTALKATAAVISVASFFCLPLATADQSAWPKKPVTLVVGYNAGGTTDILARGLSEQLAKQTGQTFIVENKPGANSNIGASYASRAPGDGHVLFVGTTANSINNALYKSLDFDLSQSFVPIAKLGSVPNLLVVNKNSEMTTLDAYIEKAKSAPGALTCASSGIGSGVHMSCALFNIQAGTDIAHIPYQGSSAAMADLLGGHVDSSFDNMPTVAANVRSGNLTGLAVTSSQRSQQFPDIPTVEEVINEPYSVESWFGLFIPAGADEKTIEAISVQVNKALQDEGFRQKIEELGTIMPDPIQNSPDDFKHFVNDELQKWEEVVDRLQLTVG